MATELANIAAVSNTFFGTIKTGNNVLVSENLGSIITENVQPFLITVTNSITSVVTSFFTKTDPNTYVRTATTLKDESGNYAIGTTLNPTSPAYTALQNGLPYVGVVTLYGLQFFSYYIPIFEPETNFVIGAYFIGFALDESTKPAPLVISSSNVTLLQYLTGPVRSVQIFPFLITQNQGNLLTATFQPILLGLASFVNNNNTLFTRSSNDFIRTATTLKDTTGNYAIDTTLSKDSPAYQPLLNGQSYQGIVTLYGYNYYAYYAPMFDSFTGSVIGAYFSGYSL
jgi:hypothetical protein